MLTKMNFTVFLMSLFIIVNICFADNKGGIRGKIIDKSTKQPLVGANITIQDSNLGATSDTEGFYFIENVEEGVYKIEISYVGYNNFVKPDIRIVPGKQTYVEEIELTEATFESDPITITAGLFQDENDSPVSSFNFTREEIKRSPGAASDIFRAISALPGVVSEGGEFSAFSVRGGGPRDNLIMVDNIPFSQLSHFDDLGLEGESAQGGRFGIFTTNLVEDAYFQAGGFPARYSGKNASIINLSINEGNFNDMTLDGHYDLFGWEANYNGPMLLLQKSGLFVSARRVDFKTILNLIDEKGHGVPNYSDVIVKSTTEINSFHKLSILGIYSQDNYTRTVENVFESKDINVNQLADHTEDKYMIGLNWRFLTGKNTFLTTTLYYFNNQKKNIEGRVNSASDNEIEPTKDNAYIRENIYDLKRDEKAQGIKSQFDYRISDNLTWLNGIEGKRTDYYYNQKLNGLDTLYEFHKNDYRPDPSQNFIIVHPEDMNAEYKYKNKYTAAYSELSYQPWKPFTINPGLRYEYYDYNNRNYVSPRLSLRYQFNSTTSLNAATGIYYQMPELYILSMDKVNHKLKNEKAYHFIFGVTHYLSDDWKLTVESYYKKIEDALVWPDRTKRVFTNDGDGKAWGVDLSLIKRFTDKFYGQVSYSYGISKRNDHNGEGSYDYDFSKPHMFNLLAGYQFNEEWSVATKWYITSGFPADDYIIHSNVHNDPNYLRYSKEVTGNNTRRYQANHSLNIRVDYRKQFRYFALNLYADVLNIYGNKNITREDFLAQSGKLNEEALQAVPSIGFKLEF